MLRGLVGNLKFVVSYIAQTFSATATSTAVDLQGYGSALFLLMTGAMTFSGTDKITVTLEESNDNVTFNVVSANDIYSPESGTVAKVLDGTEDAQTIHKVGYRGYKRYVRLVLTEAGTVSVPLSVVAVLGHPELKPVS